MIPACGHRHGKYGCTEDTCGYGKSLTPKEDAALDLERIAKQLDAWLLEHKGTLDGEEQESVDTALTLLDCVGVILDPGGTYMTRAKRNLMRRF